MKPKNGGDKVRTTNFRRSVILALLLLAPTSFTLSGCAAHHVAPDYSDIPEEYYVFFETNSAELTDDGYTIVQRAADAVYKLHPQSVIVAGFSAPQGSEAQNHQIAERRTMLVKKTLTDLGVDTKLLVTLPLGPAKDEFGPTGDRRIEIRLLKDNNEATAIQGAPTQ